MRSLTVALAGNPNVGKSSIFNALTGLHQHTGNWPGKTVSNATGRFSHRGCSFTLVDLPGTYSLRSGSVEEEIAQDYIKSDHADFVICVADATGLQRNLNLVLQIQSLLKARENSAASAPQRLILCVNLLDEAEKKKIRVDLLKLSQLLQIPVIGTCARTGRGLERLKDTLYRMALDLQNSEAARTLPLVDSLAASDGQNTAASPGHSRPISDPNSSSAGQTEEPLGKITKRARFIYESCVTAETEEPHLRDRKLDDIFTSHRTGYPVMMLLMCLIFWLTITGANLPSQWLSELFAGLDVWLRSGLESLLRQTAGSSTLPSALISLLMDGIYKTVTWVVSVMLPPMAIFFPLFTILEDSGYLPRIAFNLDHCFYRAGAHGKQALTTCMAFGCNACAVTGCRIIESPRERLIAILTNSLIPCNGKFAGLIAVLTMFFSGANAVRATGTNAISTAPAATFIPALLLTLLILFCFGMTLALSAILSKTLLKGYPSAFALELPPYRRPQFGTVILRSVFDRTLFVLGRALTVAAPAGVLIWFLAHSGLLAPLTAALDPLGRLMGLDGVILAAFLLGFPANELVIPIMLMAYLSTGVLTDYASLTELYALLAARGWTQLTALCFLLFSCVHFPCGTTILTIYKETKSRKWTLLAAVIPTLMGIVLCTAVNGLFRLFPFF